MAYTDYEQWKSTPLTNQPYLSIIIPTYNESFRIVPTIGAVASHVSGLGFPWELIIADDGSVDGTIQMIQELEFTNLTLLLTDKNGGKGSAVQRGMLVAKGKYMLFDDADNSTPIEELDKVLVKVAQEGYDVAVGSRAIAGAEAAKRSPLRRLMSNTLRGLVQNVFHIGVQDTQCGFKLFTRKAAQELYGKQTIMGFSFDLEILYLAEKYGYHIAEVPVTWRDAPGSKVDTRKEAHRFLRDLAKIKLNDWRGLYA
ncbi:glycosyltransferase family 2 protein [Anaerolineales bacterium HSG25]|nr:glycosyltransferase family 2 protein [Anaerolineales bacterium HSG25]